MSLIHKDLAILARHDWPAGKKSASITSDGMSAEYYDYPVGGKYTYPQYLHARHVLGLDEEAKKEPAMHPDLEWLARNVSEWGSDLNLGYIGKFWDGDRPMADYVASMAVDPDGRFREKGHRAIPVFSKAQWLQARQGLGLVMTEEEEAMPAEERDYGDEPDMVNKPPHYQLHEGYEVYDLRQDLARKAQAAGVPHDQFSDWDRALEYLLRMWEKNGVEDAKKGAWYVNKLIGKLESSAERALCPAETSRPDSQEWVDGLPPVGTECERHIGQDVYRVTVVGYHEDAVVVYQHDVSPDYTDVQPGYLRPIKTDAERERDEFARAILDDLDAIGINLSGDMAMAVAIGFMNRGWRKADAGLLRKGGE